MTTFTLTIETGNAAMSSAYSIADALIATASRIVSGSTEAAPIRDTNGNTVGKWEFADHDYTAIGRAFVDMWREYDADKDDAGIWPGSSADIAQDVFGIFTRHGLAVA